MRPLAAHLNEDEPGARRKASALCAPAPRLLPGIAFERMPSERERRLILKCQLHAIQLQAAHTDAERALITVLGTDVRGNETAAAQLDI